MTCGVGGAFTEQMVFENCSNCGYMVHGNLTKQEILDKISEIDKQVEMYEENRDKKYNRKWYEFWKF